MFIKMQFLSFFALLQVTINVTFACECGLEGAATRIFKGSKAQANKYPWLAHIRIWPPKRTNTFQQCGGVLIDESHVATAAHCVTNDFGKELDISLIQVFLGRVRALTDKSGFFSVSNIWVDFRFNLKELSHDFAILTLSESIVYNQTVGPICLPNNEDNLSKLMITGWGRTSDDSTISDDLMEAQVDYINRDDCKEIKKDYAMKSNDLPEYMRDQITVSEIPETHLCAINKKSQASICQGDSGGPIMKIGTNGRYYLMGVTSGLWGHCGDDSAGLFTRAYYYKNTIKAIAPNACWQD